MSEPRNSEAVDDQLGEAVPGLEQAADSTSPEQIPVSPTPQPRETVQPGE
jgi:hypothetical protein